MTYPEERPLDLVTCPTCGSANEPGETLLGTLGDGYVWFRCRYCGMDWREAR